MIEPVVGNVSSEDLQVALSDELGMQVKIYRAFQKPMAYFTLIS